MVEPSSATPSHAAPPRRRSWLRWPLRLLVVLVALVALAPLALGLGFVREAIADRLGSELGATVTIGSLSGWWTSGVTVSDLAVESPRGHAGRLLHVPRVHAKADLLALLGGRVDAKVEIERPHLTLSQNAAGRWNLDDLGRDRPPRPPARAEGPGPALALRLTGGVVEARRTAAGSALERVSGIEVTATLAPDEALDATLAALVEGAGAGGAAAAIEVAATRDADGQGPVRVKLPTLELARVAGLLESASGLKDLRGSVSLEADGRLGAAGAVSGRFTLAGRDLSARSQDGARLAIATLAGHGDVAPAAGGDALTAEIVLTDLEAADGEGTEASSLSEPQVKLTFDATRAASGDLTVSAMELSAGTALRLRSLSPLVVRPKDDRPPGLEGKAELTADLARLAALKGFVKALASLRTGTLAAGLEARPGATLDVGLGVRIANLDLAAGDLAPGGYADKDVTLQAVVVRDAAGGWVVRLHRLQSGLAALASTEPFEVRLTADGAPSLAGPLNLAVSLDAFSRGWGSTLGLEPGERLGGLARLVGTAQGGPKDGSFQGTLGIENPVLPASWSRANVAGTLAGQVTLRWGDTRVTLALAALKGLGIEADASLELARTGEGAELSRAEARVVGRLTELRERFGGLLGLAPAAALGGRMLLTVQAAPAREGTRLSGTTQVSDLVYRAAPDQPALEERALTIEHTLLSRGEDGVLAETLRLRGNGYQLDLSGTSKGGGEDGPVKLAGTLEGDAAVLAERARALLGPDLADLKGQGRVNGRLGFTGHGEDLLAGGTADVNLDLGSWSVSGVTLGGARLVVTRRDASQPYTAAFSATANGGPTRLDLTATPTQGRLPWSATATLDDVDLGTLLTRGGGARGLAFVLPTLVPLGSSTPALSGKLDARLSLSADDAEEPARMATLAGQGEIALTEGTLGQSSLFGALGRGGLGDVGSVLQKVAPEVGREVANLTRAVAYQSVTSRFRIAAQQVHLDETKLTAPAHRLELKGVVGFDQRIDLAARLWLGSKAGEELKRVLPDQTIPLRIRNTLDQPHVVPDLKAADLLKAAAAGALPKPKDVLEDPKGALDKAKKDLEDRLKGLLPR